MKIIRGTAYTIQPLDFSCNGLGISDANLAEEAVMCLSPAVTGAIDMEHTCEITFKLTQHCSNIFK
jgi:hypothetical protein